MDRWTRKKYAEELDKGYWDLEPHFYYYQQHKLFSNFETYYKNNMSIEDIRSANYGEFVTEGKPILMGFYSGMNFYSKIIKNINVRNNG